MPVVKGGKQGLALVLALACSLLIPSEAWNMKN
jgi:hypothetical protein